MSIATLLSFAGARDLARIFEQRGNPSDCRGGAIGRQDLSAPCCLLTLFDAAAAGLADCSEFDAEAECWGIEVRGLSRKDLTALIEGYTQEIPTTEHRRLYREASDFVRWGRRGGRRTLALYGQPYFSLLARFRWGRAPLEALTRHRLPFL